MDRYAVIGNPVAHSLSPRIHALFARETRQNLIYDALTAPLDGFEDTVAQFVAEGGQGCNVTLPFKEEAWALASELSDRATRAGAVNTLVVADDGTLSGDNTDGWGLVRDLTGNLGIPIRDKRLLIVGAGGAVRGVLGPLLEEGPDELVVANRTVSRAETLAREFKDPAMPVSACGLDALAGQRFDVIVNGTSAGVQGRMPALPDGLVSTGGVCYDMFYARQPTVFVDWGRQQGAQLSVDGLGMLVEQAAESFRLWRGVRPETRGVIRTLRQNQRAAD